jgi:transposase
METFPPLTIEQQQDLLMRHADLEVKVAALTHQLDQLYKLIRGSKSERFVPEGNPVHQPTLFSVEATGNVNDQPAAKIKIERSLPQKKRDMVVATGKRLPAHLPRISEEILPEGHQPDWKRIGQEESEQLHIKEAELYVKVTVRPKFVIPGQQGVTIAEMPDRVKAKGVLGDTFLAHLVTQKYVYHQPLHRQRKQFLENNVDIAVSTMADGVGHVCDTLDPLVSALKADLFNSRYLQGDESPIKVLDGNSNGKAHLGYMWVYRSPGTGQVYFDYRQGRGRDGPEELLKDFSGYLQTDGYQVYDGLALRNPAIILAGCMAHARRKFYEAQQNDHPRASRALEYFGMLYHHEKHIRENAMTHDECYQYRKEHSQPVLEEMKQYMDEQALQVLPKSTIGIAMTYSIKRWDILTRYLDDGRLEIDNNRIENAIRPLALGRKNYLFAGSDQGAKRAAIMYSLLAMCRLKEVPPTEWLLNTLRKIPSQPITKILQLLP